MRKIAIVNLRHNIKINDKTGEMKSPVFMLKLVNICKKLLTKNMRIFDTNFERLHFAEIKNYAGRVCIVHGTKDKIVDVSYAKRAAEAYKSTMPIGMQDSKRVQLHFIDGGGHMFSKKHDVIAMKLLKEFAAKHE